MVLLSGRLRPYYGWGLPDASLAYLFGVVATKKNVVRRRLQQVHRAQREKHRTGKFLFLSLNYEVLGWVFIIRPHSLKVWRPLLPCDTPITHPPRNRPRLQSTWIWRRPPGIYLENAHTLWLLSNSPQTTPKNWLTELNSLKYLTT